MAQFLRISKHAGKPIDMGISWKPYIDAAVRKLLPVVADARLGPNGTAQVSKARMDAALVLERLKLDVSHPAIVGDKGMIVSVRSNNDRYIVLYRRDRSNALGQKVEEFWQGGGAVACKYIDAFFLFLVKEFDVPLRQSVTKADIEASLKLENDRSVVDFDDAMGFHGYFFAWKVDEATSTEQFADLLTWMEDEQHCLRFGPDDCDYGASELQGRSVGFKIFDLRQLCRSVINPLALVTDCNIQEASLTLAASVQLHRALVDISPSREELVFGPGGGVCFKFSEGGKKFLALSLRNFHAFEADEVVNFLTGLGVNEVEFEDDHFLSFVSIHGKYLDVSREWLAQPRGLENKLDIKDVFVSSLEEVKQTYEDVRVFDLSQTPDASLFGVLCSLATKFKTARSPFIPSEIIDISQRLLLLPNVPFENIYLSLSASHWKHAFIEIYRVVEGLYYFGWMHEMKRAIGGAEAEYDLYLKLYDQISWRYKERPSIAKLFEVVPRTILAAHDPVTIKSLNGRFEGKDNVMVMTGFANLIYSIRNSNVHQAEAENESPIEIGAECWPKLTCCLFLIVEHFYSKHQAGMPPNQ